MSQHKQYQPLTCKKCGIGGFYYPSVNEDTGKWKKIGDRFGEVVAFEHPFDIPHWFICPSDQRGADNRKKAEEELTKTKQIELQRKEKLALSEKKPVVPGQQTMPFEKMTELDRKIAEKIHVIELCLDDIKGYLKQKAE